MPVGEDNEAVGSLLVSRVSPFLLGDDVVFFVVVSFVVVVVAVVLVVVTVTCDDGDDGTDKVDRRSSLSFSFLTSFGCVS